MLICIQYELYPDELDVLPVEVVVVVVVVVVVELMAGVTTPLYIMPGLLGRPHQSPVRTHAPF